MPHNHDDFEENGLIPIERGSDGQSYQPARQKVGTTVDLVPPQLRLQEASPFIVTSAKEISPHRSLCMALRPESAASQQYRTLRFKLKEGQNPRLIGITSAVPQEGKTTVAANLGLALAEGRKVRVMLLDLNLRAPALARRFGLSVFGSLADQLRLRQRKPDARWEVMQLQDQLHLMAGGEPVDNPSPLLNSDQMAALINDLAAHYDHVVVDLPGVLVAADAGSIQDYLDTLILACRSGFSRRSSVSNAVSRLGPRRLHGVLMLDVDGRFVAY